jgi:hypothetical protein
MGLNPVMFILISQHLYSFNIAQLQNETSILVGFAPLAMNSTTTLHPLPKQGIVLFRDL